MQSFDSISLTNYHHQQRHSDAMDHAQTRAYFSPTDNNMRRKWAILNKTHTVVDPWPGYALQSLMTVLHDTNVDKSNLIAVLNALNKQRLWVAQQTRTLGQRPGWEFGNKRQQALHTPCNAIPGNYQDGYQLFLQQRHHYTCKTETVPHALHPFFESAVTYTCPRDALLGEIGSFTCFQFHARLPVAVKERLHPGSGQLSVYNELNHFDHNKIADALRRVTPLYTHTYRTTYEHPRELMRALARIHRYLAIICFAERGSSAIAQWTVQLLALVKGYPLFNPMQAFEHNIDFCAYLLPEEEYLTRFSRLATAPTFQYDAPRQRFIVDLHAAFKRRASAHQWYQLCAKLDALLASNSRVNYPHLLAEIITHAQASTRLTCCGFTLWSNACSVNFDELILLPAPESSSLVRPKKLEQNIK